jgi:hypothetical protein
MGITPSPEFAVASCKRHGDLSEDGDLSPIQSWLSTINRLSQSLALLSRSSRNLERVENAHKEVPGNPYRSDWLPEIREPAPVAAIIASSSSLEEFPAMSRPFS